ncbi:MAG: hypothetical protein ACNS62_13245 [Candidatus Cyclobacteriaceae bacterium M3_2C_046]
MKLFLVLFVVINLNMNQIMSEPIINIWGSEDAMITKQQILFYLDFLDVHENINLMVGITNDIPEGLQGITFLNLNDPHPYITIVVYILANLSENKFSEVLAHEMVHVKQFAKGELQLASGNDIIWQERRYNTQFEHDIFATPWEREAFLNDNILVKAFKNQEILFLEP